MSVLFLFIDGIGLGNKGKENPFYTNTYESFEILSNGNYFKKAPNYVTDKQLYKGIDANLGVEGLPQSGTGQTALFTGQNAAKEIGKHFGPFPHSGIKHFLKKDSIFNDVNQLGKEAYFMNAYPPIFFEHAQKRNRWSCTTLMTKSAGLPLNSTEEIKAGLALTAEIIQNAWREQLNIDIPKIDTREAANRVLNMLQIKDLVLYEYYLTDKAGHSKKEENAQRVLKPLDEFLLHLLKGMNSNDTLIISSDHGNLEDLSVKTHTRNEVPLFVYGQGANLFKDVNSILEVKNTLLDIL